MDSLKLLFYGYVFFYYYSQGQNVSILCHSKNQRENSPNFGYTWVKNGELVKMNVPYLYYEDLYQRGSILHINNVQVKINQICNRNFI